MTHPSHWRAFEVSNLRTIATTIGLMASVACVMEDVELDDNEAFASAIPCTHYVSIATEAADLPGYGTSAFPWRTIHYAVNHVGPGAKVCERAGTYNENVDFGISGTASAPITLTRTGTGEVVVDGTIRTVGFGACPPTIGIYGRSHLRIASLTIVNQGNAGFPGPPYGECQASGMLVTGGGGQGSVYRDSEDIVIGSNVFRDIGPARTDQLGLPLGFGSYVPGASVHHIQIDNNLFRDNDTINEATGIRVGALAVVGDAHDFAITHNTFDDPDTGGVEAAGNQGNDLQPVGGVISDNQFLRSGSVGPYYNAGVYLQGTDYVLVERNFFDRTGIAVSVHTEPPYTTPGTPCPFVPKLAGHAVVRNNLMVNTVFQDFRAGANDNGQPCNYFSVDSVYVTNNTIYRPATGAYAAFFIPRNSGAGLIGDNKFLDNIIMTPGRAFEIYPFYGAPPISSIESDYNYIVSPRPDPFFWGTPMTWSEWSAARDLHSRFGTEFLPTIFVQPAPVARSDFALSATITPPHNGGAPRQPFQSPPTTPSWAYYGAYQPMAEYDLYQGSRDLSLRRDIGADER